MERGRRRRPALDLVPNGCRPARTPRREPPGAGTPWSAGASHFLQRASRKQHEGRRSGIETALLARLIDVTDFTALLREIARGARLLSRAAGAEIVLWRASPQAGQPGAAPRSRGKAPESKKSGTNGGGPDSPPRTPSMLVPLRHVGRSLGCVRLYLQRPPERERLAALHRYLAHAGAALARVLAEERVLRQQRRNEALLDSLPDACLLILSPRGTVLGARGHVRELVDSEPENLVGRSLVGGDGRRSLLRLSHSRLRQLIAAARRSGKAETESWLQSGAREVQVQVTIVDQLHGGEMACVLRDLTEVKAMEAALLRRNEELTLAAERLKEIDTLKNEFLSNVSHELRTPLTAIIAYSEALLLNPAEPETQRDFLNVVAEQGQKLQRLIVGLLDMAKLETLATELKLQPASLNEVVRAAVVTVRPLADKSRIGIEIDMQPDLPCAYLDELRAQQIVWNLLTNAIKFSPPGSTVRVRTWSAEAQVWVSVTDQGIGIAPEHHKLIFEKFVQLDGSSTRRQGGVGLGLDLVKHLVELHGGDVQVESTAGAGSTFTIGIPIEKRSQPRLGDTVGAVAGTRAGR